MLSQISHLVKLPSISTESLYIDPCAVVAIAPLGEGVGCRIFLHHATRFLCSLSSDEAARQLGDMGEEAPSAIPEEEEKPAPGVDLLEELANILEPGPEWSADKPAQEGLKDNADVEPLIASAVGSPLTDRSDPSFRSRRMSAYDDISDLVDALEAVLKTTESEAAFPDDPKTIARNRAEKCLRSFGRYPR